MFYRAQVETARANTQMPTHVQMPCLLCRTLVVGQEVLMHLFLGQVRCDSCSATLTTCREFRTLAPLQTYCTKELKVSGRGGGRGRGRGGEKDRCRGRNKSRGKGRGRGMSGGRGRGSNRGRGRGTGRCGDEMKMSRQLSGPGSEFSEEHGRLGWTIDPVDVLAYYTRRWLVLRGEQPSSPGLLHEMAKFLQMYSPLESLPPWRPAIARCWHYVTKMSRFHLTRSLRAPLEASEGKQWDKAYSKRMKMSAEEASVGRSDSKVQEHEKSDLPQNIKFNNGKNIGKYSTRSNAFSIDYISGEGEGNINPSSNMKKTTKRNAARKEDISSREKSYSPACFSVVEEHKAARKRKNETYSKTQRKRRKQRQNKVDTVLASVEEWNGYSDELKSKRKASTRQVVDVVEVEMDEKDNSNEKHNSLTGENMNQCERDDDPFLIPSDDLKFSLSNTSVTVYNSQTTATTSNLGNGEEPADAQDGEVSVISSKPSVVPESLVITSDDLTEKALLVPLGSISECELQGSDVDEVDIKENIELRETKVLEATKMMPAEERVSDSEFGDLLLPEVFSESQLDEVVEVVSLVGCDASWEVETSFTATKLLHVCWEGLDHHASCREIGGVRS